MRVCILSDSHDNRHLLAEAGRDAVARGAAAILHCGDVVAPTTLRVLLPLDVPVHVIHGNNMGDLATLSRLAHRDDNRLAYHGQDAALELAGRRVFLVHFPHYARALAATGDWDLVCCGHDHRPYVEQVQNVAGGTTPVVNPGTVGGVGHAPTYVLADLDAMTFEVLPVPVPEEQACNRTPVTPHD